ncbi:MAG: hypothetical protein KC636_25175, partial [Myxococcales bacterium]|nr:hypothetical protein [Myxococcales bacterium]
QYAPLVGGARGAADLGLTRGFWGHALVPALPALEELSEGTGASAPVYLHDLHELSRRQYEREGRWPTRLRPAGARKAQLGLLFHERHMLTYELELWEAIGPAPARVIELHDVPLTSVYARSARR